MAPAGNADPELDALDQVQMDEIDVMFERLGRGHYEVLEVHRGCERVQVRTAYFEKMKRFHPDVFCDRDLGLYRPRVEAIFRELTTAFEVLCDTRRRAEYDGSLDVLRGSARAPSNDTRIKSTGISRRPSMQSVGLGTPPPPPPPSDPARTTPRPSGEIERAKRTPVPSSVRPDSRPPPPMPTDERVPKEITLQSLMRGRTEHMLKHRRERVTEMLERVAQAETRNEPQEALSLLRQAAALAPDDDDIKQRVERADATASSALYERLSKAAQVHEKDARWESAAEAWIRAASERPRELAPLLGMVAASCEGRVDLQRAAEYARRATQLDPRSAEAFALLGRVFFLTGRMASARGAVENALKIDGLHPLATDLAKRMKTR